MSNTYFLSSEIASGYAFHTQIASRPPPARPFLRAALSRAPFSALDCLKKLLDVLSGVQRV